MEALLDMDSGKNYFWVEQSAELVDQKERVVGVVCPRDAGPREQKRAREETSR